MQIPGSKIYLQLFHICKMYTVFCACAHNVLAESYCTCNDSHLAIKIYDVAPSNVRKHKLIIDVDKQLNEGEVPEIYMRSIFFIFKRNFKPIN